MPENTETGAASRLKAARAALDEVPADGAYHQRHSDLLDDYFRDRLAEQWPPTSVPPEEKPFAVMAVGGYGRRELCPHSDIDILVVYEKKIPTEALDLAQSLLVPLWDMGYDLGHGFRSVKDCVRLAREDFQVMASLLDARLVAGNPKVFDTFVKTVDKSIIKRKKKEFISYLDQRGGPVEDRADDEGYLLEPDLKNGRGGLRDYHRILWLGRVGYGRGTVEGLLKAGALTESEAQAVSDMSGFLLTVRTRLHLAAGRRNNRLTFDHQVRLAGELGFTEKGGSLPVERFLAVLHRAMAGLHALYRSFRTQVEALDAGAAEKPERLAPGVVRHGRELAFDLPRDYPDDPMVLMHIFECAAGTGLPLTWAARRLVSAHLYLAGRWLAGKPEAVRAFEHILASGRAFSTLEQMRETGFLGALIPEFARVQDMVQFDTYHLHPVGRHSLMTIGYLEQLGASGDPRLGPLWLELPDRLRLIWAALMHDIGKGLGGGHSEKGAVIARKSLKPFGLAEDALQDVEFLVREHLLLSEAAERRDLGDESQVASVAGIIGSASRLDMLLLLTYADARATGPKAWSGWKASLVNELYDKVSRILAQGALAGPHAAQKALRTRDALRRMAREVMDSDALERRMADMPARYALTMEPVAIIGHLQMADRLDAALAEDARRKPGHSAGKGVVILEAGPAAHKGLWQVTLAAKDRPGLFSTFCGVFALHDINIDFAECFTWRDGTVIDRFVVAELPEFLTPEETWERVRYSIRAALTGRLSLEYRIEEKRRSPLAKKGRALAPKIGVDNASSDFYTLVEIEAADRVGLLYDVSKAMFDQDLSIHLAKIATFGDQVRDVFFVRDSLGRKVEDAESIAAVESALKHSLSS